MTEMTFVDAWLKNDPKLMADAKAMWVRSGLLYAQDAEERAKQLIALAYVDERVVGVSTARIQYYEMFHTRMAYYRCAVAPEFRRRDISYRLSGFARHVLEEWSAAHPEEGVMGLAAFIQAAEYRGKQLEPTWPEHGLNLDLVGYTEGGDQVRVAWFRHAEVEPSAA